MATEAGASGSASGSTPLWSLTYAERQQRKREQEALDAKRDANVAAREKAVRDAFLAQLREKQAAEATEEAERNARIAAEKKARAEAQNAAREAARHASMRSRELNDKRAARIAHIEQERATRAREAILAIREEHAAEVKDKAARIEASREKMVADRATAQHKVREQRGAQHQLDERRSSAIAKLDERFTEKEREYAAEQIRIKSDEQRTRVQKADDARRAREQQVAQHVADLRAAKEEAARREAVEKLRSQAEEEREKERRKREVARIERLRKEQAEERAASAAKKKEEAEQRQQEAVRQQQQREREQSAVAALDQRRSEHIAQRMQARSQREHEYLASILTSKAERDASAEARHAKAQELHEQRVAELAARRQAEEDAARKAKEVEMKRLENIARLEREANAKEVKRIAELRERADRERQAEDERHEQLKEAARAKAAEQADERRRRQQKWEELEARRAAHIQQRDDEWRRKEAQRALSLNDRGLLVAAHWAASMLSSMLPADAVGEGAGAAGDDEDSGSWPPAAASGTGSAAPSSSAAAAALLQARMAGGVSEAASDDEADLFLLAKTALDCRAYHRAAHVTAAARSPRTRFIHWYSLYMAGEQQRDDAAYEQGDLLEGANNRPVNANALRILNELRAYREQLDQAAASDARRTTRRAPLGGKGGSAAEPPRRGESLDGFSLYLLGVVYNDLDNKERAAQALIESVCAYPYNWSAWLLLATVAPDATVIDQVQQSLDLSDAAAGTMLQLFAAHTLLAHQQNEQARQLYEELMQTFPSSTYVRGQIGLSYYNVRDFESAGAILSEVVADDPHGLQYVDVLSNILYVSEEREKLAELARQVQSTDRYRPETCCVIGNYYSSKGEHERAIKYFVRALRLNPSYLSAWTLMGHEFVEMRNAAAAVQAYRRAVDLDPRDYRAWYGLGQTYELLQMPLYALHYFRKAAALRPFDSRMWCAMAECYVALERRMDAIRCFERAVENVDREGIALSRLARLYHELGDTATAAKYYEMHVQAVDEQRIDMDVSEAMIYLAHHYKHVGNLDAAEQTCQRLLVARSESEREEARSLLRELQAIRAQQQQQLQ